MVKQALIHLHSQIECKEMEPRERVGWYGNFLSQLMGGMPQGAGTQVTDAQGAMSPAMQAAQTGSRSR